MFLLYTIILFSFFAETENVSEERILYIAINSSFESSLLKDELTRDWTKPNPDALKTMTEQDKENLYLLGNKFNLIRESLNLKFKFVEWPNVPNDLRIYPSFKFGKYGVWEPFDKRAFQTTTMPLLTVRYLNDLYYTKDAEDFQKRKYKLEYIRYLEEIRRVEKPIIDQLKVKYPNYNFFNFTRESLGYYGYLFESKTWEYIAKEPTNDEELNSKYLHFYTKYGKVTFISAFEGDLMEWVELDIKDIKGLDAEIPDCPKPFVYVDPYPPWEKYNVFDYTDADYYIYQKHKWIR